MDNLKPSEGSVIFCEMCPEGDRKPARKTCMKCEISMCVQHLQAHLTTPVLLQTHPLTEPTASAGGTKCSQHGKLVEYYCLDDLTCVCVSCAIEDQHRLHNLKTFSTAHKELLDKLLADQKEILSKTDDDNLSLEKWEVKENEKVTESSVRLMEAISKLRHLALASVQASVSARMSSIKTSKSSILAAQNEKDTYRFLQLFSQVHQDVEKAKAVDLRKGLVSGSDRDKLVEEINSETIIEQAVDFWGSLLEMVDPENHQQIIPTSEDLLFEVQTFSSGMLLSSDKREVLYCSNMGECSAFLLIQSSVSADISRWIVGLPQDYDWMVGLCDNQNGPVYGLSRENNQISVLSTECHDVFDTGPQKNKKKTSTYVLSNPEQVAVPEIETVEVILASFVLSFFSRSGQYQRRLIHSLNIDPNVRDLKHFVKLGKGNVHFTPQHEWRCSCGTRHNTQPMHKFKNTCSCGAIIAGIRTTELICKLV